MSSNIKDELKSEARGYTSWSVENAVDFPDKILPQCDVILDSESGEVLTAGGILQLTGAGKIGKTMLLLNILFGLAIGRYVLGFRISKPRRVLYLNGENSSRTMQSRLKLLRDYFCIDDEQADLLRKNLLIVNGGFSIQQPDVLKDIRGNLKEIRPGVLVIDPLKNFYSGEENSADDMRKFMVAVRELIREFNLTVIIIHHTGKKQNDNNFYSGRGSSLLADDAETTVSFQKDVNNKGLFNLFVTGRNCDEFTLHLTKQPERWYLYSLTDKPEPSPDHTLIEIIDSLPENFTTGLFNEAALRKGLSLRTAGDRLRTAVDSGLIERVVQGKFRKVPVMQVMQFPKCAAQPAQQVIPENEVMQVMQFPIGVAEVAETFHPENAPEVMQVMRNDADCTTRTTEPNDEYRGLF